MKRKRKKFKLQRIVQILVLYLFKTKNNKTLDIQNKRLKQQTWRLINKAIHTLQLCVKMVTVNI